MVAWIFNVYSGQKSVSIIGWNELYRPPSIFVVISVPFVLDYRNIDVGRRCSKGNTGGHTDLGEICRLIPCISSNFNENGNSKKPMLREKFLVFLFQVFQHAIFIVHQAYYLLFFPFILLSLLWSKYWLTSYFLCILQDATFGNYHWVYRQV